MFCWNNKAYRRFKTLYSLQFYLGFFKSFFGLIQNNLNIILTLNFKINIYNND